VFKAIIPSTLLYGSETWALSEPLIQRLDVALHECLRMSLNISRADRVRNEDIRQRCNHRDIPSIIRENRLRFLGHIARRPDSRILKQMLFATHTPLAEGKPRQGGQTIIHTLRDDLQDTNMSPNWYLLAQDRTSWRADIRDALDIDT